MEEYSCNEKLSFEKNVVRIALPVTLQSLLQSSFSVIDQVMIGQLGSSSIAGIGLGGKFASRVCRCAGSRVYGALCTVSTKDYGSLHPR